MSNLLSNTQGSCTVLRDSVSFMGSLSVYRKYTDGTLDLAFTEDNLIVLNGRLHLLGGLCSGGSVSSIGSTSFISTLRAGTGGTIDPEGKFPKPVTKTLTALFNEVSSSSVSYTADLSYPSITFVSEIPNESNNGVLISEAGLFFEDGSMFNIKTFPGIPKTLDFSIVFQWTIRIN